MSKYNRHPSWAAWSVSQRRNKGLTMNIPPGSLAAALKGVRPSKDHIGQRLAWIQSCYAIADVLASINPAFDRATFYTACGLDRPTPRVDSGVYYE